MGPDRDRVICISLTEHEWQAFVARHPQPVDWLRACIQAEVGAATASSAQASYAPDTRVKGTPLSRPISNA